MRIREPAHLKTETQKHIEALSLGFHSYFSPGAPDGQSATAGLCRGGGFSKIVIQFEGFPRCSAISYYFLRAYTIYYHSRLRIPMEAALEIVN